ncbi:MFS transporter [Noviherbaspirillum soli]|uniref:MFS transporter n=1 Tax=Noviherbaspirillum soli TaxID=1064518 RepID=UPI00188B12D0|nr:MFS transporter [Noviherbaspirillum soli]
MEHNKTNWHRIGSLGFTLIASYGSLLYAFSLLAPEIHRTLGWRMELVFGAFSWGLLVAGLSSTPTGLLIDRFGGRFVMAAGSLICGAGLIGLSQVQALWQYYAAWTVLGVGMALVFYEAAFATINRAWTTDARSGISTVTLIAGFASTVFWPLTLKLNTMLGWRDTYLVYGVLQLVVCFPLHYLLSAPPMRASTPSHPTTSRSYSLREVVREPRFWKLACAFATNSFIFSALAVHLIPLLHKMGHSIATVVFFAAFIGPMQVTGRVGEMVFARRAAPEVVGKLTFAMLPAALAVLLFLGIEQWVVAAFCGLYGLSNGILTIVRGTVPQKLFGRENYGAITGALAGPTLMAQAAGPLVIAALVEAEISSKAVFTTLLTISLASAAFYIAAVRRQSAPKRSEGELDSN